MALLRPDHYFESVVAIDLDELQALDIRMLLLDLDNTLVLRNTTQASPAVHEWVQDAMARGIGVCIVSNNWHERVQNAADALGCAIVGKATKPFPSGFRRALDGTGVGPGSTAVVGDQIFTDVLGGNLFGATTILVVPLAGGSDLPHTRLLRAFERRIMRGAKPRVGRSASGASSETDAEDASS